MSAESTGTYTVLARRFRPQAFADVVGQEHVAQALRNAIRGNRVAHAYMFTGARGVGKTSTARILAKALNCPNAVDGNPCNDCEICRGISAGNDVDVLEIDGASNRGIEDIRALRANVNVRSMRTHYKIIIIDEVHMLTREAFNALLKTLEEPPPNVKFVFCTTEPNKVPDTILSRCQRFDFGTIETSSIRGRLAQIATAEGVQVDDDALELVARRAAGSMRDSQSIFDQLLAFGEQHVTAADVHRLLGTASDDRLIAIAEALVGRSQSGALQAFHEALDGGVQLGELTDQILFYLRDLMVLATGAATIDLLAVAPGSRSILQTQAGQWGLQSIVSAMQIMSDAKTRMQRVTYGRALAELALVRIAMLEELISVGTLIEQLKVGDSAAAPQAGEKKNDAAGRAPLTARRQTTAPASVPVQPLEPPVAETPQAAASEPELTPSGVDSSAEQSDSGAASGSRSSTPTGTASTDESDQAGAPFGADNPAMQDAEESQEAAPASASPSGEMAPATGAAIAFKPENAAVLWSQIVGQLSDMLRTNSKKVSAHAIVAPNKLELTFPRNYHFAKRFCEKPENVQRLEKLASELTGVAVRIAMVFGDATEEAQGRDGSGSAGGRGSANRQYDPEKDEFVRGIMEVFAAQCVQIKPISSGSGDGDTDA